jgi:hypothetical protein
MARVAAAFGREQLERCPSFRPQGAKAQILRI